MSNISETKNDVSNADTNSSASVVPDLPDLEPIQEAKNAEITKNTENKESRGVTTSENSLATEDSDSPITVVRLPKVEQAEQKTTSEIQQVSYEEPIMEPLPDAPVVNGDTRPNQWQGVNSKSSADSSTQDPKTAETESTEQQAEKKIVLPKPMTENEPLEPGNINDLPETLPEVEANVQPNNPSTTTNEPEIPAGVFDLPTDTTKNDSQSSDTDANLPTELPTLKTSQNTKNPEGKIVQCSAVEPVTQLQMSSLEFVTAIRKKGDFTAVAKPYSFKPGQTLLLYMEIENPNLITKFNSGFEVTDHSGKKVLAQSTSSDIPANESSFFQYVKFALPDNLVPGDYAVRVWGKAPNEKDLSSAKLCFQVE